MSSKQLTAKVRLDTRDIESKLKNLESRIKNIQKAISGGSSKSNLESQLNKQALAAEKVKQATLKTQLAQEKLAAQQLKTNKLKEQAANLEAQKLAKEQAMVDRIIDREIQGVRLVQQEKWKAFLQEQQAYERELANRQKLNEELQKEKIRQQNLNTIGAGDKAAERLALNARKQAIASAEVANNYDKINRKVTQTANQTQRTNSVMSRLRSILSNIVTSSYNAGNKFRGITNSVKEWLTNQNKVNHSLRSTNTALGSVWGRLKAIASTYLGVMGMRAVVQTSDTITAAENKLNYLNGGDVALTQESMDKMYTSAQKVRMSYTDMMANVSKSMTLAGDAFQSNTDNAIRFQEIMAEAYAVGGASAAEMHSSMYQMIQALGSGILAGDELRSVREGAPLAYKAIEEFAQGVYNTNESLKELGSQGKITSDMVVAAIMNAGNQMDTAFAQTHQTFAQTWEQIKNVAKKSFEPVAHMMRDELNKAVDSGLIEKLEKVFTTVSKVLQIIAKVVINTINWIAENWDWLKNLIVAGLLVLAGMWIWQAGVAIVSFIAMLVAMTPVQWTLLIILTMVLSLVYVFYLWKTAAIDTCQAIVTALMIVGAAILLIGLIFNITALIAIGAILIVLGVIFMFFEQVCGVGWAILTFVGNLVQDILNTVAGMIVLIIGLIFNLGTFILNVIMGVLNFIGAFCSNVETLWNNMCSSLSSWFWNAIADMLEGCEWLMTALNKIAEFFGKDTITIEGIREKANKAASGKRDYISYGDAWNKGFNTHDYFDINSGIEQATSLFGTGLADWSWNDAYNDGSSWGAGVKDSINKWGSKLQLNGNKSKGLLDNLGDKLGLNFGQIFPDGTGVDGGDFSTGGLGSGYDPSKALKGISDDTGRIADSLDLTQEDLEYLRRVADMEWKKEYTTANIHVDMSNYNTVNGDSDLDGIVTKLADKLYEEMNVIADGVYVY